jgi:hypothetical protein
MSRILKHDVVRSMTKGTISAISLESENLLHPHKVDIGFKAKKMIQEISIRKDGPSERQILALRLDTRKFLTAIVKKMQEKSPLANKLVRNLDWAIPSKVTSQKAKAHLESSLDHFVNCKRLDIDSVDSIIQEFTALQDLATSEKATVFSGFDKKADRLDEFWCTATYDDFPELWKVLKVILCLSHGQAQVEGGFSIKKQQSYVNLGEKGIVTRRIVEDHKRAVGGILNVELTTKLLTACSTARQK